MVAMAAMGASLLMWPAGRSEPLKPGETAAGTMSRSSDGRILHRFLGAATDGTTGDGRAPIESGAPAGPTKGTPTKTSNLAAENRQAAPPVFVYDPRRGSGAAVPDAPATGGMVEPPVLTDQGLSRPGDKQPSPETAPAVGAAATAPEGTTVAEATNPDTDIGTAEASEPSESNATTGDTDGPADGETANGGTAPSERAVPASPEAATDVPDGENGGTATGDGGATAGEETRMRFGDRVRPDNATEREAELEYHEVFNPSIVPHKRGRALNAVDAAFDVHLVRGALRPVRIGSTERGVPGGRDTFAAEALVESNGVDPVPLPSVSSDDLILGWEAIPAQDVRFYRDDADNIYAALPKVGRARLTWRVAAPRSYFSRSLNNLQNVAAGSVPANLRPVVPPTVRLQARDVARGIGLAPAASLGATLDHLVYYFRSFAPGEPPPARAGIYRDLALGQVGVCRHRAFAFVVTAQGLGIPARYVYNEAHVFVEVWLPAAADALAGWTRIDLGGGAETLDIHGGAGKTLYQPPPDGFPEPPGFNSDALAGATEVRGLPSAPRPPEPIGSEPRTSAESATNGGMENNGKTIATPNAPEAPAKRTSLADGPFRWPATLLASATASARDTTAAFLANAGDLRQKARLSLTIGVRDVVRGVPFPVGGQLIGADGEPIRDAFVQILLEAPGRAGMTPWVLGAARPGPDGHYNATVAIPASLEPGAYELVVEFPGTNTHQPAIVR